MSFYLENIFMFILEFAFFNHFPLLFWYCTWAFSIFLDGKCGWTISFTFCGHFFWLKMFKSEKLKNFDLRTITYYYYSVKDKIEIKTNEHNLSYGFIYHIYSKHAYVKHLKQKKKVSHFTFKNKNKIRVRQIE